MASKLTELTKKVAHLKSVNADLMAKNAELEQNIERLLRLQERQQSSAGVDLADYMQLQNNNEKLIFENNLLKQKVKRLDETVSYLKSVSSEAIKTNVRGAGRKSILSQEQRAEICQKKQAGVSYRALAKEYGCSPATIVNVCSKIK